MGSVSWPCAGTIPCRCWKLRTALRVSVSNNSGEGRGVASTFPRQVCNWRIGSGRRGGQEYDLDTAVACLTVGVVSEATGCFSPKVKGPTETRLERPGVRRSMASMSRWRTDSARRVPSCRL